MLQHLRQHLTERHTAQLYRTRHIVHGSQGTEIEIEGRRYLNFCSNDYLGLAAHPALATALAQTAWHNGCGAGASHLINGHSTAHHALEQALAAYTGRERALLFSTGYMANLGAITALVGKGDAIFLDRLAHASLIDGARLSGARFQRYPHNDLNRLEALLRSSCARHKLIVTDGVFSMDGDIADVSSLVDLAQRYHAWLMIDDAHGLGVTGAQGHGSVAGWDQDQVPILVGTLGKAFGVFGAFVAGRSELIEYLIQFARSYIYTTALPPSVASAACIGVQLAQRESWRRTRLFALVRQFRREAQARGIPLCSSQTPIQPITMGDAALQLSNALFAEGILVTAIRPPTVPQGSARLRVTFSAIHGSQQVTQLVTALGRYF